jgi:hypothetical protein
MSYRVSSSTADLIDEPVVRWRRGILLIVRIPLLFGKIQALGGNHFAHSRNASLNRAV